MTATAESTSKLPFAYDERILIRSSSTGSWKTESSSTTTTKTIRLESLSQWKNDAWIHPFSDIELGLSSNNMYKDQISRVEMSISSHGAQRFPTGSKGLDHVPTLPLGLDDDGSSETSVHENDGYLSKPQGFFLSIQPADGLSPKEEARAVQAVFQELMRSRLLTTPVTGGEWDVVENTEGGRLYQLILPFDGAAWSSDALAQSFRKTLPSVCEEEQKGSDRFFGWSPLEWSNFLVGYKDGGGELGQGDSQSLQHLTYNKVMWWTWTSSGKNEKSNNEQSLSFGIQYQTTIPPEARDWLPETFLDKTSKCPIGKRTAFEVLPLSDASPANSYQLVPIAGISDEATHDEQTSSSNFLYSIGIEQALRRHHTNRGRFESSVELIPLFDTTDNTISCQLKYRQAFPNFLCPMWRSLRITKNEIDDTANVGGAFYSNWDDLQASVTWDPDDKSSILTVETISHENSMEATTLPSAFSISLEYAPSFLTIDDFPGDPNRGRVLPPASVSVQCYPSAEGHNTNMIVYSNSLLLLPPVPDLSMPFNVISLTSSLYAYIIGAIITILVRKGSEKIKYKMYPDKKPESKLTKIKTKLREKFGGVKAKFMGKKDTKSKQKDSPQESTSETHCKTE